MAIFCGLTYLNLNHKHQKKLFYLTILKKNNQNFYKKSIKMSKIFFTSDLHFSHKNIAKFCPHTRPQPKQKGDINTLNEYMIALWNDTVGVDDIVYNLGDVSFSHNVADIKGVLSRLNGHHHLIFGNHDDIIRQNSNEFLNTFKKDGKPLLSSVQEYLKLKLDNKTFVLFHYPIFEWDGCHQGYYHLHGHIHERISQVRGRILNVGFDLHARFLTVNEIMDYLDNLPKINYFDDKTIFDSLTVPPILKNNCAYEPSKNNSDILKNNQTIQDLIKQQLLSNN